MDNALQHDYAKAVFLFLQKIPHELNITDTEIDAYFRECVLYITAHSDPVKNDAGSGILNQLYTEVPVSLSPEPIAGKINYFQSDKSASVAIPDFFHRMLTSDAASGTCRSGEFIHMQQGIFELYATCAETFSFEESRRILFLNDQLKAVCSKAGVMETVFLEVKGVNTSQNTLKKLNDSLVGSTKSIIRKRYIGTQKNMKQEDPLEMAEQVCQEVTREVEAILSSKKAQEEKETPSLNLSSGRYTTLKTTDMVRPSRSKKVPQDKRGKEQEEEYDDQQDPAKDDGQQKDRDHAKPKPTLEEALTELNGMIGLDAVKSQVESIIKFIKISKLREKYDSKTQPMSYHLAFLGNPGTGKTTVARIIADIYAALGILRKGQLVEIGGRDLVGQYVGKTETKTKKIIKKARGGVLFIDEAYLLAKKVDKGGYGKSAIGIITKAMDDHRDDLVVIVAGYDKPMKDFIESNEGLESRFPTKIFFEDYNGKQLYG